MSLAVKINVALREQNCQKIGSERVNLYHVMTPTFFFWHEGTQFSEYTCQLYDAQFIHYAFLCWQKNKISMHCFGVTLEQMSREIKSLATFFQVFIRMMSWNVKSPHPTSVLERSGENG